MDVLNYCMNTLSNFLKAAVFLTVVGYGQTQAQVYKCVVNGSTTYQPTECATGSGAALNGLQYHGGATAPAPKPAPEKTVEAPARSVETAKAPEPLVAQTPQKSELERNADTCLNWYKAFLKDPRSAYYENLLMDKTVLNMQLYSKNSYGGIVSKAAACEFKGSSLDDGWTKIQAKRRGWGAHLTIID